MRSRLRHIKDQGKREVITIYEQVAVLDVVTDVL